MAPVTLPFTRTLALVTRCRTARIHPYDISNRDRAHDRDLRLWKELGYSAIRVTVTLAKRSLPWFVISARACCCIRAHAWKSGPPKRTCRSSTVWKSSMLRHGGDDITVASL